MRVFVLKPLSVCDTNSYIVAGDSGSCALIDAPDDAEYILEQIEMLGLTLKKIFLTHGHFDHVGAVADLVEATGCEVYIHQKDYSKLLNGDTVARFFGLGEVKPVNSAIPFGDDEILKLDEIEFSVLHTPGHTSGSCCFIAGDKMFTGDTLFARSVGRTDMPDGNTELLKRSLEKIYALTGDYTVYPGHMSVTTLEAERHYNPYLCHLGDI